jgi:hypothetical protein
VRRFWLRFRRSDTATRARCDLLLEIDYTLGGCYMDQDKLTYFISRYKTLDGDDLAELHSRRDTLAEEAILALDTVLSEKVINKDILGSFSETLPEVEAPSEAVLARRLWKGRLAMSCKLAFAMAAWYPVKHALDLSGVVLGVLSLWGAVIAVALGYAGYRVGHAVTRSICASENTTYEEKKRGLWFLLFGAVALYFVLFVIAGLIFRSAK